MNGERKTKWSAGLAALALTLSCALLPGCESKPANTENASIPTSAPAISSSPTASLVTDPTTPSMPQPSAPNPLQLPQKGEQVNRDHIVEADAFSQGLARIRLAEINTHVFYINTLGEVEFALEGDYYQLHGFCNGYALLLRQQKVFLCDAQGNLHGPEEFGGAEFLMQGDLPTMLDLELFRDGYLPIRKAGATEEKSQEIGIYDLKNQCFIYPFSPEPYAEDGSGLRWMGGSYFDGYIYRVTALGVSEDYFDLRDGQFKVGFKQLPMEEDGRYASIFWEIRGSAIVDARKSQRRHPPVVVMELPYQDIERVEVFEKGMLVFRATEDAQGEVKQYCTMLDLQGNVLQEAFEITGMQVITDGQYLLAYNEDGLLRVYNTEGLVAEKQIFLGKDPRILFAEGILLVWDMAEKETVYRYLTTKLVPLYE